MSGCKHECHKPAVFPKNIFNRPALDRIDCRIGTYSLMREYLLDNLNKSSILSDWTHRGPDDPGIALLEAAAVVGDILTYYQDVYGNEAFLRTASWRESVADLVQLLGYRLAPGVGGEATFALKVKGTNKVTVPRFFGFKAQLDNQEQAAEFESTKETTAYPHLSEFNLYSPPKAPQNITAGSVQLELAAVAERTDLANLTAFEIKEGARIMLVPDTSVFDNDGESYGPQDKTEIVIVSKVETILNRVVITLKGSLTENRGTNVRAYVVDRTFKHFGHNAPRMLNKFDGASISQEETNFEREIDSASSGSGYYSQYPELEMPLDQTVNDLALGGKLICQGVGGIEHSTASLSAIQTDVPFTVVKEIESVRADSLQWGNLEGSTTIVLLKEKLITNASIQNAKMDIRQTCFHEVVSPELTLRALTEWDDGAFSDGKLRFLGTYDEARALLERNLLLVHEEKGTTQTVRITTAPNAFDVALGTNGKDRTNRWMWDVTLDRVPEFNREDFDQVEPKIKVYGNLVYANQGKTQQEVVLGSGDSRRTFQTFAIPKAPLTYLLDETRTPAQVPELKVYVEGLLWKEVSVLLNSRPDDRVYVVREDRDGKSWVQFGNGKTGARLPSGINNVVAIYRTGVGAAGSLKADTKPQATGKLKELESVFLPGPVVGGDDAESEETARVAAPGRIQSLGRLVGLADFEAEALAIPGVIKVRADWAAPNGVPQVRIVILTKNGTPAALNKVRDILNTYNRCRGPARFPIGVEQGVYQYVYLRVRAGCDASYRQADVETATKKALGLTGEEGNGIVNDGGLFAMQARRFGQGAHVSQIMAVIQQVKGVTWVEVDDAQALNLGSPPQTDPAQLAKPTVASTDSAIGCPPTRVLALHSAHFDLNLAMDKTKRECS